MKRVGFLLVLFCSPTIAAGKMVEHTLTLTVHGWKKVLEAAFVKPTYQPPEGHILGLEEMFIAIADIYAINGAADALHQSKLEEIWKDIYVPQEVKKRIRLFQRAQDGDAKSQYELGTLYLNGQMLSLNPLFEKPEPIYRTLHGAYFWLNKAKMQGHVKAREEFKFLDKTLDFFNLVDKDDE